MIMKRYVKADTLPTADEIRNMSYKQKYDYISDILNMRRDQRHEYLNNLSTDTLDVLAHIYDYNLIFWLTLVPSLSAESCKYIVDNFSGEPIRLSYILDNLNSIHKVTDDMADILITAISRRFPENKTKSRYPTYVIEEYIEILSEYFYNHPDSASLINRLSELIVNSRKWPSAKKWKNIDYEDQFEDMWSTYLSSQEDEINKELRVFPEPSIQGGIGDMFIHDQSDEANEPIIIDFDEWCDTECKLAAASKSADQYKEKYRQYIESLINTYWSK